MDLGNFASDDFEVEVPYGPPEDGAFVTIRYMPIEKSRELIRKTTKISYDPATHQPTSRTNDKEFERLYGEWAVTGWRGFEQDGKEFPFCPENRDALMAGHRGFRKFVFGIADEIGELTRIEREKIRGN
jgi:hypothetical protein